MQFTKKLLFLFIFFGWYTSYGQESNEKEVLSIFTFEEAEKLQQEKVKPILIFIYTDWCKICHGMKRTTFKNKKVISLLNEKFYFIQLNGEEKKDITFLGKKFRYKPTGNKTGMHELAEELASIDGKTIFPTTTIINSNLEIALQIDSYIDSKSMNLILKKMLLTEN